MINYFVWSMVGGLLGWAASKISGTASQQAIVINIVVGITGAFLAALVLTPLFGTSVGSQNSFSFHAMLVALLGAFTLLTLRSFFQRNALR